MPNVARPGTAPASSHPLKTLAPTRPRQLLLVVLALAALVSLAVGIHRALEESPDLQWGGVRLLAHGIDPWGEAIHGYPHHLENFSPPNYLFHLYLLLLPLQWISFPAAAALWCALNLLLSVVTMLLLRRLFELTAFHTAALLLLLWMSSPFRVLLAAGQMTLVELFCFTVAFSSLPLALRGLAFGVSFAKYSFSPPTALFFLFRGRLRLLLLALAVPVLGLVAVSLLLPTPIAHLAGEPLALAGRAVMPGLADLMTLVEYTLRLHLARISSQHITYAVTLLASAAYALLLSRFELTRAAEFALLSIASLFLFKHLAYDFVFLLPPLCYALSPAGRNLRLPVASLVLVFWFLTGKLSHSSTDTGIVNLPILFADNLLLAILLAIATVGILHAAQPRRSSSPSSPAPRSSS